jgi:two-component system OmpR family sensor kinase
VFEGDRVAGVLAIAGPGLTSTDLPAAHVIAHHLASLLASSPGEPGSGVSARVGLGRVSALIASEIREPVRNLASLSSRLRERLFRDTALLPLAAELDRGATRLRLLLEDLLDYTRPLTPWKDAVPLDVIARSVVASVQRVCSEACAGRALVLEVDRPAPIARLDPALLSRALSNVMVNVAERTPITSGITVSILSRDGQARIQIRADGYEPKKADPVEPFDALSPALRRRHAIGLTVARRLTRAAGGRLVLERRRSGSSYSFRFPEIDQRTGRIEE